MCLGRRRAKKYRSNNDKYEFLQHYYLRRRKNDMNVDIDENDCIVVETKGGEFGKRSAGSAGVL
jgi:hypothetical protein